MDVDFVSVAMTIGGRITKEGLPPAQLTPPTRILPRTVTAFPNSMEGGVHRRQISFFRGFPHPTGSPLCGKWVETWAFIPNTLVSFLFDKTNTSFFCCALGQERSWGAWPCPPYCGAASGRASELSNCKNKMKKKPTSGHYLLRC